MWHRKTVLGATGAASKSAPRSTLADRLTKVFCVTCCLIPVALVILGVWNTRDATKKTEPITRLGGHVYYTGDGGGIALGVEGARSVDLSDRLVTDDDLAAMRGALESLPNLRSISLGRTQITDNGLKHLSGLTQVQSIDLDQNQVTLEGVSRLQKQLRQCKVISSHLKEADE